MTKKLIFALAIMGATVMAQGAMADLEQDRAKADAYLAEEDFKKAFKQYRELAREGDHDSQYMVAEMYATGTGTKKDMYDAYAWSTLAAQSGLDASQTYSDDLLAQIDNKEKAKKAALKLDSKYGKEALQAKADRYAMTSSRGSGQRAGACTGSRLSCSRRVEAVGVSTVSGGGAVAPPQASGGN